MGRKIPLVEYLDNVDLPKEEKKIIFDYIKSREMSGKTEKGRACIFVKLSKYLHESDSSFTTLKMDDITQLSKKIKAECKPNTKQTYISNLKSISKYINKKHHKIEGIFEELSDIKAGSPVPGEDKTVLIENEWFTLLNSKGLTVRDRAMLQLLYNGYHRPKEILLLKWSDFKPSDDGSYSYIMIFKTGKPRYIQMSNETKNILLEWRKWLGNVPDDSPVFPRRDGTFYHTNQIIDALFRKINIKHFTPSCVRPTAITHDVSQADTNTTTVCLKAWGKANSELISTYAAKVDSLKLQREAYQRDRKKRGILDVPEPVKQFGIGRYKEEEIEFNKFMMEPDRLIRLGMFLKKQQEKEKEKEIKE